MVQVLCRQSICQALKKYRQSLISLLMHQEEAFLQLKIKYNLTLMLYHSQKTVEAK